MYRVWLLILLAVAAGALGCRKEVSVPAAAAAAGVDPVNGHLLAAQPRLPTTRIWLGNQELAAEIARRPVEIATGMMFRTNMPDTEAMLFVFPNADRREFYMRNCVVPLSAAYIDPEGVILQIVDLHPREETPVPSESANVQFVLEVPQGWFTRRQVNVGALIRTERGTLRETFFKQR